MTRSRIGLIVVLVLLAFGASCANQKPTEETREKVASSVGVLFTVDGITVYRFGDQGRYHYFAVNTGRPDTVMTSTAWSETRSCGKNCTTTQHYDEQIETIVARWRAGTPGR